MLLCASFYSALLVYAYSFYDSQSKISGTFTASTIASATALLPFTVLMLYLVWIVCDTDGPTGKRLRISNDDDTARQGRLHFWMLHAMARYFPVTLHATVPIPPPPPTTGTNNKTSNTPHSDPTTPEQLQQEQEQQPAYLFLYHPHGIIGMGANAALNTNACHFDTIFPKLRHRRGVTLQAPFYYPFYREVLISLGYVHSHKSTLVRLLRTERTSLVLVPGGAPETLYTHAQKFCVRRKTAFVRLAWETGAHMVPCLGFGENRAFGVYNPYFVVAAAAAATANATNTTNATTQSKYYSTNLSVLMARFVCAVQQWLCAVTSVAIPILTSPFCHRHAIDVVVGAPLAFHRLAAAVPDDDDDDTNNNSSNKTTSSVVAFDQLSSAQQQALVDLSLVQYMAAVEKLYNEHKDRYGHSDIPLEWVD